MRKHTIHTYTITVANFLHKRWEGWLGNYVVDIRISNQDLKKTILTVRVPDQTALRDILNKLWDLNLKLLSVTRDDNTREV